MIQTLSWESFHSEFINQNGLLWEDTQSFPGYNHCTHFFELLSQEVYTTKDIHSEEHLTDIFKRIEDANKRGIYVIGFFHYELGFPLQKIQITYTESSHTELFHLYFFAKKKVFLYQDPLLLDLQKTEVMNVTPEISKERYIRDILNCQDFLRKGESYELNYTFPVLINGTGNPFHLYQSLKRKQRTKCSVYFQDGDRYTLSLSPEIFFQWDGNQIFTEPMKGTANRGMSYEEDQRIGKDLALSEKERAENVMITDLFRNDLGKVSEIGSVKVKNLFRTEAFGTIWQMTTQILSQSLPEMDSLSLVKSLFPSGSVTGAPKKRSMELLRHLENRNRGLYTGSILWFERAEDQFTVTANVCIRTLQLRYQKDEWTGMYSVGSGITVLSEPEAEWEECLSKLHFLQSPTFPDFEILESFLLCEGRFRFLQDHLQRMKESAFRFGFPFDENKAYSTLKVVSEQRNGSYKIRFLLSKEGHFKYETSPFSRDRSKTKVKLVMAKQPLDKKNIFVYHKTTNRSFYDEQSNVKKEKLADDVLFLDEDGNLAETQIRNVFYKWKGHWYTPSLRKGGLPGILRKRLLQKAWVQIRDLHIEEIEDVEEILVGNSLRGLSPASLVPN
ncbi:putative para-aminobenzoate synthase component I [Leptospira ryugenii]|uniref:Putative para-aminobenzoate synthase component I n=1 Tax=Leptospira ryugenii TaxID=1917863 RepID=A0A2P2DYQ6_9LEPT|nr:bifunctional anthranilate synthase component I family protein/class IV aminotransferase [Leptospira ryugenii]GBF49752.1 putative para-aminobenzoate synthase component I [Leptospira ryugenii]